MWRNRAADGRKDVKEDRDTLSIGAEGLRPEPKRQRSEAAPPPPPRGQLEAQLAAAAASGGAATAAPARMQWHYKDASGKEQGPFDQTQMEQWHKQGFLPLDCNVRPAVDSQFFPLSRCQEIAGAGAQPLRPPPPPCASRAASDSGPRLTWHGVPAAAEPRTPTQWKERGNAQMAAGRVKEAIAAYGTGLEACQSTDGGDAEQMRGVLFSNRSGAHLQVDDGAAALADARQCVAARPDWGKAHYRLVRPHICPPTHLLR